MPASITVLSAGAVKPGLIQVLDAFRRETGNEVRVDFATAPEIRKRFTHGEVADVVIAPSDLLEESVIRGKSPGDRMIVGRIGVGVMVRADAPLPKIATVEQFRKSLLDAESIVYNQASTGAYLERLFNRIGIAANLASKSTRYPDFAGVLEHVVKGHGNEIGLGATTVIVESASKGVRFAGPLPAEIQNYTVYVATLTAVGQEREPAREFVDYLNAPAARSLFSRAGIESY